MQVATFVIATLSLLVALTALGWNITQWRLSGGRPRATLVLGALAPGGAIVAEPGFDLARNFDQLAAQGYDRRVIGVRVTNTGRTAIRVQRWAVQCEDSGIAYVPLADAIGPTLPYSVEAGAQESWLVDLQTASALTYANEGVSGKREPVRVTVELADGQTLRSDRSVHVGT